MPGTVISVENLSKCYRLGVIGTGTFHGDLDRWLAKWRGKPDPYQIIGQADHGNRQGETLWALKDISFQVQQGEALGIIGRNGAGKSTLLKILSQVTAPTSGTVRVKGRIASLLEVGTGFHPELTGRENIYLNGAIMGMNRAEVANKFDEIVDFSGVDQFIDTPVKRYSSGMYVRLAFAVAAHLEPEILVVDEVLAVGDIEFQKKCLGKMGDVAKEGRTVLFVSHNMVAVASLCSKGLLIDGGKIEQAGEADFVISKYLGKYETKAEYRSSRSPTIKNKLGIVRASLLKNNVISDTFYSSENLTLQIECEVKESIKGAQIAFDLLNEADQYVFSSTNQDLTRRKDILAPGTYVFECKFALNLLRSGKYRINVSSSIPAIEMLDIADSSLVFNLLDDSSPMLMLGQNRRGIIFLELPWTVLPKG